MKNYTVHQGQSLIDIACELYGNAEMVVKLAVNNNLGITDTLVGKMVLQYDDTITALIDTSTYFRLNNLNVIAPDIDETNDDLIEHSREEHGVSEHN